MAPSSAGARRGARCSSRSTSARKPCGVCTVTSKDRSRVSATVRVSRGSGPIDPAPIDPAGRRRFTVSAGVRPGTTATTGSRTAPATAANTLAGVRARAASWTSTTVASRVRACSPAATEACRSAPPATTTTGSVRPAPVQAPRTRAAQEPTFPAGTTTTRWSTTGRPVEGSAAAAAATATSSSVVDPAVASALGTPSPSLVPEPAATTTQPTARAAACRAPPARVGSIASSGSSGSSMASGGPVTGRSRVGRRPCARWPW